MRSPADNVIHPPPTPPHPTRPRARADLTGLPAERLEAEVLDLTARMAAGTYELLVLVGELDRRGSWATWGALSCAAWLADRCDIELSTARTQVRIARAMVQFPALDTAMAEGEVSYAKARVLVAQLTAENVDALLDLAERNPAARLGTAIAAWAQRNEDPETIRTRQHEARSASWRTEADGTVVLTARLTPEAAGKFIAAVDATVTRTNAPAGASLAQQRTDAFVAIVTGGNGNVKAEVVIHVTAAGNRLPDGTPLSDDAVVELLPDAYVSLLLHDEACRPIDASPRRRHRTRRRSRAGPARSFGRGR